MQRLIDDFIPVEQRGFPNHSPGVYRLIKCPEFFKLLERGHHITDPEVGNTIAIFNPNLRFRVLEYDYTTHSYNLDDAKVRHARSMIPTIEDPMLLLDPASANIAVAYMFKTDTVLMPLVEKWIQFGMYNEHLFDLAQRFEDVRDAWLSPPGVVQRYDHFLKCDDIETMIVNTDHAPLPVVAAMDLTKLQNKYALNPIRETLWTTIQRDVPNSPARNAEFFDVANYVDPSDMEAAELPSTVLLSVVKQRTDYVTPTTDVDWTKAREDELEPTVFTKYVHRLIDLRDWVGLVKLIQTADDFRIPELVKIIPDGPWTRSIIRNRQCSRPSHLHPGVTFHNTAILEHWKLQGTVLTETFATAIEEHNVPMIQWCAKHARVHASSTVHRAAMRHPTMVPYVQAAGVKLNKAAALAKIGNEQQALNVLGWDDKPVPESEYVLRRLLIMGYAEAALKHMQQNPDVNLYFDGYLPSPAYPKLLLWAIVHRRLVNPEDVDLPRLLSINAHACLHSLL